MENRINIKLTHVTLSLVHNSNQEKRPTEYLLITLKEIELVQISTELA
jgi:type VI protein secretion system component Hcp